MNTVSMLMFLFKFISTKQRTYLSLVAARCVGMKHSNIKNALCRLRQKPLACISALASSLRLADAGTRASPVSGCKGGSTAMLRLTHFMEPAYSQISKLIMTDES